MVPALRDLAQGATLKTEGRLHLETHEAAADMTIDSLKSAPVLVIGAGIMGAGIAQVAAQAGHAVKLFDARDGAAAQAKGKLADSLAGLVAKGKLDAAAVDATLARITPVATLREAADARLVVEAIVEQLATKRALFAELESLLSDDAVIATNTSSISVTALANGMAHPARLVGMHFFNPVPLMKLVEVVSGLHTDAGLADAIFELSKTWGKVPVHARSTPGFIVNRIARPYYAEALALLGERAIEPAALDACLRGAGFRMGPCELMDLIGHDTNFAVTNSVYEANFFDKRYVPSLVQREMVDGGLFGRKTGRGFFTYVAGKPMVSADAAVGEAPADASLGNIVLHGRGPCAELLAARLTAAGLGFDRAAQSGWTGLTLGGAAAGAALRLTDGRSASQVAAAGPQREVAVFDLPIAWLGVAQRAAATVPGVALAFSVAAQARADLSEIAAGALRALGFAPQPVADTPGLVVARSVAMLINEAADAVQQGVCTPDGADAAMKLGVNYPDGPFEWLARWDASAAIDVIEALDACYRGERYRVSPWLRQAAWRAAGV